MKITKSQLKSIVLFPGAGIADFGYPCPPQAVVDFDKWGLEAYRQNHPGITKLIEANLATETAKSVIEKMGLQSEPDFISSGSPCQGFSSGRGPDSQRHAELRSLYFRLFDYCQILRPRFAMAENVGGILTPKLVKYVNWLRNDLKSIGYQTEVWDLDALDFGGCQRRRRVFVVASRVGAIPLKPVGTATPMTLRQVIGHLSEDEALADGCAQMSKCFLRMVSNVKAGEPLHINSNHRRFEWDKCIPPLMTGPVVATSMKAVHPERSRFLSCREFAYCMAVPGFKFPRFMPLEKRYEIIGQAVPPFLTKAVVERLVGLD